MKKIALALLAVPCFVVTASAENLHIHGSTDRNAMLYKVGDPIVFTVELRDADAGNTLVKGKKLIWACRGDDGKKTQGEAPSDKPLRIETTLDRPGFVRLLVKAADHDGKRLRSKNRNEELCFDGGAGAGVNDIRQSAPEPSDFDSFWKGEAERLYAAGYTPNFVEIPSGDPAFKAIRFEVPTLPGERPATGVAAWPRKAAPGSLPLLLEFFGYGYGATPIPIRWAKTNCLVVSITRHGEDPMASKEYYEDLKKNAMKDFGFRHTNDRLANDFRGMLLRDLRAAQFARTLPEWNGKDIIARGGSMGGYQAVAVTALDPTITACDAFIPWMANLAGARIDRRMGGWTPAWDDALGYYDTVNFAKRISCPVKMTIFLGDYVCPPSGEAVLFNSFAGKKTLNVYQNGGHGFLREPKPQMFHFEGEIR